jgi:transcriptional regulator with XRE-family HTH domain
MPAQQVGAPALLGDDAAESAYVDAGELVTALVPEEYAITRSVGAQVRAERHKRHLMLHDLAGSSGLSVAMLSKVENAQLSPSLRTLGRLARALDVPVTSFFRGLDEDHDASFVKAGQGIRLVLPGEGPGHRYELVTAPFQQRRRMEAWVVVLPEPGEEFPLFQGAGSQLVYMLEGCMTWRYGQQTYEMRPGDCFFFDAFVAHGPERLLEAPVRFLDITIEDSVDGH